MYSGKLMIVESGAAQFLIVEFKAQGVNQVQL